MLQDRQWRCEQGHCFDQAKEGYVNLLPVQKKRSAEPGDNRQMLQARRAFLQQGHYRPLAEALLRHCRNHLQDRPGGRILDTGCGEGYYTGLIAAALPGVAMAGIDIARDAARMASKRYPEVRFAVASNADLPLADNIVDCALRVFAPPADAEIARVLKPGGCFLRVTPGANHLMGLRERVYDRPKPRSEASTELEGFVFQQREHLAFKLDLQGPGAVADLFAMTPFYWQTSAAKQETINALPNLNVDISFHLDVFLLVQS